MAALSKSVVAGALLGIAVTACSVSCRQAPTIGADDAAAEAGHVAAIDANVTPDANTPPRMLYRRPDGGIRGCKAIGTTLYAPEDDAVVEVADKVIRHDARGLYPRGPGGSPTWGITSDHLLWSTMSDRHTFQVMEVATHRMLAPLRFREECGLPKSIDGQLVLVLADDTCGSKYGCWSIVRMTATGGVATTLLEPQSIGIIDYAWKGDDLYWLGTIFDPFATLYHTRISAKKTTTVLKTKDMMGQLHVVGSELWYMRRGRLSKLVGDVPVDVWRDDSLGGDEPFIPNPPHVFVHWHGDIVDIDLEHQTKSTLSHSNSPASEFVWLGGNEFRWCTSAAVYAWP